MNRLLVRDLLPNDVPPIFSILNGDFPKLDLDNKLYCIQRIVEDDVHNIIAAGIVRITSETILIVDKTMPKSERTRTLDLLFNNMKCAAKELGLDETHIFLYDEDIRFPALLVRMFKFIRCKAKRVLYLRF